MMNKDRYRTQKLINEMNQSKIISALKAEPKTFNNLKEFTGLSNSGLNKNIKNLKSRNLIQKTLYQEKEAYTLTSKGQKHSQYIWGILQKIVELQTQNASYSDCGDFKDRGIASFLIAKFDSYSDYRIYPNIKGIEDELFSYVRKLVIKSRFLPDKPLPKTKLLLIFDIDYEKLISKLFQIENQTLLK